jgi:hypothetical protein
VKVSFLFSFSFSRKIQKKIARKNKLINCVFTNVCPLHIGLAWYIVWSMQLYAKNLTMLVILFQFSDVASMVSVPRGM